MLTIPKYPVHDGLTSVFSALQKGYREVNPYRGLQELDYFFDAFEDHGSHFLVGSRMTTDILEDTIQELKSKLPWSEPYFVGSDEKDWFLVITNDPDHLAQMLESNKLAKVGRFSPEELEAYKVHKA